MSRFTSSVLSLLSVACLAACVDEVESDLELAAAVEVPAAGGKADGGWETTAT
ncbi:MAG: hypothetical protein H0T79_13275 [Deltaproteobacteria bacterium]|nr:hypothetical protein [Deltaproteobacteria bacterium]